jgi:hypothetical protein
VKQSGAIIGVIEYPDGWSFVCRLCGKKHEVPEGDSAVLERCRDTQSNTFRGSDAWMLGKSGNGAILISAFTAFKVA